mgnify:CR=1 FL=1
MEEQNNKNLVLAMVLSALVMLVWMVFFPPPEPTVSTEATETATAMTEPAAGVDPAAETVEMAPTADAPRVPIETARLSGSISLRGARIDDLSLLDYRETLDPASKTIQLLAPYGNDQPYYALFAWVPAGSLGYEDVPGSTTEWTLAKGDRLSPGKPVTLSWNNGKGLEFNREISVDENYLFTVTETVKNTGTGDATLAPYGQIARHGLPKGMQNIFVVHEGVVGRADGELTETDYQDITEFDVIEREGNPAQLTEATTDGWVGFTDHYWMSVLIPEQNRPHAQVIKYDAKRDIYQTEVRLPPVTIAAGAEVTTTTRLFAGAKEWATIRAYGNEGGIPGFIDSIDWGWFYFLTKPIFAVLHWLNQMIGNMGVAIIALTFILKLLVLPLAYKSYVSMARMKELQPEMEALKERAGDDRQKLQREMMQLYKDKKVTPAAGCLPILFQIPIFFSLYKVIYVTIELRQAPFFGYFRDLSMPDPSSIMNLFGILPWAGPEPHTLMATIFLGILPLILGISMWLQQKLNPAPTDPVQASIFAWMPWVFMFMMGSFASGLIVYWITNNTITFTQQYLIMWSHGKRPDIFGNIKAAKAAKVAAKEAARPAAPANRATPPTGKAGKK